MQVRVREAPEAPALLLDDDQCHSMHVWTFSHTISRIVFFVSSAHIRVSAVEQSQIYTLFYTSCLGRL